jgi:GNAT superfamily N-acetyltransferase
MSLGRPKSSPPITVEPLASQDLDTVVRVHLEAFPGFFLSFLGPRFLKEFYASFLVDPAGMGFVACEGEVQVLGAVVGPLNPQGYFKRLLRRRWWAFCLASVGAAARNPACLKRLIRAAFYRGEAPSGPVRALLSSVAVLPSAQGHGVGKALVRRWTQEARRRGAVGCYLTTDAQGNNGTNAFYQRAGWRLECVYLTPERRQMNRYVLDW